MERRKPWMQRRAIQSGVAAAMLFGMLSGVSNRALAQEESAEKVATFDIPASGIDAAARKHPLYPALQLAHESYKSINENIRDYTCTLVRRERVDGKLGTHEFIDVKLRHQQVENGEVVTPFGVYLKFLKPATVEGREALYVEGRYSGKVFVRKGGQRRAYMSSFIKPDSPLAMQDNRYPITELGFKRMVERLIEVINHDMQYGECEVNFYAGAKVDGRECTRVEVIHPVQRDHFRFHKAMVFVDDKDKLPLGYASFYWPSEPGGKPRLLEEYIYTDIQLNVGLTDEDFDRDNPKYGFTRERNPASDE